MNIKNAKYNKSRLKKENTSISCVIGGRHVCVPMSLGNTDYQEILKQVKEGTLTIKDTD
tara:strand:- start:202 stop:378 length:177 start_codon:yes stop_codon:yes gene_type:complete